MKKQDMKVEEWKPIHRYAFAFLAFVSIGTGTLTLLRGKLHLQNGWDGPLFAPFCIFVGLLALIGVFTHRKKNK